MSPKLKCLCMVRDQVTMTLVMQANFEVAAVFWGSLTLMMQVISFGSGL